MPELSVDVESREANGREVCFVTVVGDLDLASSGQLRAVLASPECTGAPALLIDVREVSFMDSSGLAALLETAEKRGPSLAVVFVPDSAVGRMLELTDSRAHVNGAESLQAALETLESDK